MSWLVRHQQSGGQWTPTAKDANTTLLTGLVARSLAAAQRAGIKVPGNALSSAYHHLSQFTDATAEPYMLATFTLAAMDSGDDRLVRDTVTRLAGLAREERGGVYWDL